MDKAGNAATVSATVNIDKTTPEAVIRFDAAAQDIKVFNSETGAEGKETRAGMALLELLTAKGALSYRY